jgi:hypothetical protein
MMAQAARDPVFYAAMTIANQDAAFVGDVCIRCHSPRAWLFGRSEPTDGSNINRSDRDAVNCHFCHRMVDPFYEEGVSPPVDEEVLELIETLPVTLGGGTFILDQFDRRRGKRADSNPPHSHELSPFHEDADFCSTCHDVSNPVFLRQEDDSYVVTAVDERHPTGNKYDMFPLERTFSEWLLSDYANGGVDAEGRFGGNRRVVSTCQDCHMPDVESRVSNQKDDPVRTDVAAHDLAGGNAWVQDMVINLYPDEIDEHARASLQAGKARAVSMLQRAATMSLRQAGDSIVVRVTNETGHKLPTGYPEGRRIWLNVRFFDDEDALLEERGAYDAETADLTTSDTTVFEIRLGLDQAMAELTGRPAGPSLHFALANTIEKDNRIPPRGFDRDAYRVFQSPSVPAIYADGQNWKDTRFAIPVGAAWVSVALRYQTSSKEFITFLRDENVTDDRGQVLFEQWGLTGKSPPVEMAADDLAIVAFETGDFDGDGDVDLSDYGPWADCITGPGGGPIEPPCEPADVDDDGDVDLHDYSLVQRRFDS